LRDALPFSLRRTINNLTDNALKASPAGSGVVLASGKNHDGWAWVAVADEWKGIDPSVVEKGSKRGLGLTIVRQIVESHGGRLAAHRSVERGSTLIMWLPMVGSDGSS